MKKRKFESSPRCGFESNTTLRLTDKPSPFKDLISVNGIPSAKDANLINDYVQKVHGEIQRLETILKEVQEEKSCLQSIADSHSALLSRFRKFPLEVLALIFQHTIAIPPPRNNSPWLPGDMTRVHAVLCALGSVCRDWRATVLSTPSLWAHFNIGLRSERGCGNPLRLLEAMLDRSHNADLYIGRSGFIDNDFDKQCLRDLLGRLLPTSHRWKSASFGFDDDSEDMYEQIRGRLPLLERLELCSFYASRETWKDFCAFENVPRLRELALGKGLDPVQEFPLPWSQITRLSINHRINPDHLYAVFPITPNLQFLRMSEQCDSICPGSYWEPDEPNSFIVCPTLRHLDVADTALFRGATLPSLEEISIGLLSTEPEDDRKLGAEIFHEFLHRSQCPLRKLTVQLGEGMPDYATIFDPATSLTCLDITLPSMKSACGLLDELLETELLPQLHSLKVICIAWEAYNEYDDAELGEGIAALFDCRYMPFAADIRSVHVEVVLGGKMVADPLRLYERTPDGPFLSEQFWKSFEDDLRDAPELRSRMVTERKERCAIISVNPATV
ncbi:hypothetical protein F5146DRAFT_1118658 [Armillaria mellea]|nr:hypothetical protein F5146DRAFT_1118658 [Armillaria mellea]